MFKGQVTLRFCVHFVHKRGGVRKKKILLFSFGRVDLLPNYVRLVKLGDSNLSSRKRERIFWCSGDGPRREYGLNGGWICDEVFPESSQNPRAPKGPLFGQNRCIFVQFST
jgi:hypothetical protein